MTRRPQRQDSLHDQLASLRKLAVEHGLYDADDWIARKLDPCYAQASSKNDAVCEHLVEQREEGGKYQATCSCGWESVRCRDLAASVAQANGHMGHYLDLSARAANGRGGK